MKKLFFIVLYLNNFQLLSMHMGRVLSFMEIRGESCTLRAYNEAEYKKGSYIKQHFFYTVMYCGKRRGDFSSLFEARRALGKAYLESGH